MSNKLKTLSVILIGVIALVLVSYCQKTMALGVGWTVYLTANSNKEMNLNNLASKESSYFCIQEGQPLSENTLFTVKEEVNIIGDNEIDYVMCYIATQPNADSQPQNSANPNYSLKQKSVYAYYSIWQEKHGLHYAYGSPVECQDDSWITTAREKFKKWEKAKNASITNNKTVESLKKEIYNYNGQSYIKVGPFNFTYTGQDPNVTIKVTDQNKNNLSVLYGVYSGSTLDVTSTFSAKEYSEKDFYVLVNPNSGATALNLEVTLTDNREDYSGTVSILQADGGVNGHSWQNVIHIVGSVTPKQTKDVVPMDNIPLTGDLTIIKTDKDSGAKLDNVGFILYNTQLGQYVASTSENAVATYTTDRNAAKEFISGVDGNAGEILIKNLLVGTYEIYETENPNYGYTVDVDQSLSTVQVGSGEDSIELPNEKQTGNLRIEKKDADNSDIKLQGVSFRIRKNISVEDEEALADFVEGRGDVNGNGYLEEDDIQDILRYVSEKIDLTEEQLEQADVNGDGEVDVADMRLLLRKIQSTGYVVGMELNTAGELTPITTATGSVHFDSMTTTNNPQEATIFVTDENGLIQIYNMLTGSYIIEEISVGDNFGYDVDPNFISWEITNSDGTVDTVDLSTSAIVEVTRQSSTETSTTESQNANIVVDKNRRKFIKINGYAWEEKTDGKNSTKDSIYNDGSTDRRLEHVTVRLRDANGDIITDGNKIAETTTNANGEYVFGNYDENPNAMKIEIDDLIGAYIEFEYNGMSYQTIDINTEFDDYTETTSNGNTVMKYTSNTNKATDSAKRDDFNNEYATISQGISSDTNGNKIHDIKYNYDSTNHKSTVIYGDNVLYGYEGQAYPIAGVYPQYTIQAVTAKSETNNVLCTGVTAEKIREDAVVEIGGLNLGVEERAMPDLAIVQDMEHVQISLNEYTHTYQYARRFDDPSEYAGGDPFDTTVRFANKYIENSYSREVYSSDVSYNSQNAESMQVYITYILALRNESADVVSNIKTLSNYYDERYDAVYVRDDSFVRNDDGMMIEYGEDISSEPDESYHENGMKKENIFANYVIEPSQTRYLTITYELSNEAINSLLNLNNITLDSVTEITSYSTYTDGTRPYAGIDIDSAPDTVNIEVQDNKVSIQNTMEDDTDKAPTLEIIPTEGRILKGTVWEDNAIQSLLEQSKYDKERKGNGIYDNDENVVNKVTVDLMTGTDANNLQPAYLYKEDGTRVIATTKTNEQGNYTLSGVIPNADYLLRFTYNNNSVIYDPAGNIIENVDVDNYKSTIYRGGIKEEDQGLDWYKEETSKFEDAKRWSDAKDTVGEMEDGTVIPDIVQTRTTQDTEINYGTVTEDKQLSSISADTANFEIELEYDINDINFDHISAYNNQLVWVFDNMDFGIIERPKQSLEVDKQVANLKITLANGTTLINGDPRTQNLSGVRVLDNHDVYIEIDNEIIQGSTLTVTYEISVDNTNCEIDYNDEDYYIYGIRPADYQNVYKIARVVDMYDYLPSELLFQESTNTNWEKIAIQDTDKGTILSDEVYEAVKGLQNIVHLKTAVFKDMLPGTKAVDTTLVVSRQLSTSSDDLTYENDVEVIKLEDRATYNSTPGNYDPTTNTPDELDDGNVPVTITAPTGGNRQYFLYGALGISLLIIVGVGIVFIKKKVL